MYLSDEELINGQTLHYSIIGTKIPTYARLNSKMVMEGKDC